MSKKITQQDLLVQHQQVFRLIILISNQIIRQSQLTEILLKTNYVKNPTAATRLLQRLEEFELIKRYKEEVTNFKSVQATKTAVKFIIGPKATVVKLSGVIRETKNAMRVELFKYYFLENEMTLEEALNKATQGISNLFGSYEVFYDELSANSLAFHSFNSKSSNFFLQKREIEYVKSQQQRRLHKNAKRVVDESEKRKKISKDDRRCWTLETLAQHQIYLIEAFLNDVSEEVRKDWVDAHFSRVEGFEAKTLHLRFALLTISDSPDKRNLVKSIMNIAKYVRRSFKMHESYFIRNNNIKKAIVNIEVEIDVVLLNNKALKKIDQADLIDWFKKKMELRLRRENALASFKHSFNVNFISTDVNQNNEHLQ